MDRRIGLISRLNAAITDTRDPRYITHTLRELLTQHVFQLATGYEDSSEKLLAGHPNGANTLRRDPLFKPAAADKAPLDTNNLLAVARHTPDWPPVVLGRLLLRCVCDTLLRSSSLREQPHRTSSRTRRYRAPCRRYVCSARSNMRPNPGRKPFARCLRLKLCRATPGGRTRITDASL